MTNAPIKPEAPDAGAGSETCAVMAIQEGPRLPLTWAAVILPFGLVFTSGVFMLLGTLARGNPKPLIELLGWHDARSFAVLTYGAGLLLALLLLMFMLRRGGLQLRDVGLRGKLNWGGIVRAIGGTTAAWLLYPLVQQLTAFAGISMYWESVRETAVSSFSPVDVAATTVGAVILAPVAEEIIYRGYLMTALMQRLPLWLAFGLAVLVFAGLHVPFFGPGFALYMIPWTAIACYLYLKSDNLYPAILYHIGNNIGGYILLPMISS